ncbi:MAG: PEGA domain-containing protein, partial [Candidatus Cloacimonetes bacterium]|nr:PEGA domain-containing protein [Candidatus Cloacimonadota bacterium]
SNLFIDGKLIGTTPLTRDLTSGNYEIELKKDGYQPVKQTIRVIRNDFLDFTLSPLGKLNINVWQEDARVFVNNQRIDDLKKDISLPVGNATVRIEASKAFTESFSVPIQANSTTFLEVSLITDLDAIERMNILKRSYKTWEDFYDKTQEKQLVKIERGAHDSIVQTVVILVGGVFVAVSDLVISPVIIASLILGKPLFGGEPDPNAEYYAAATGKKFYSILHMIFDPNSFTKVVKKRYPDAQHNNMLKTTASQRASEHNQVINERISSIQKGLQNSFVRYRINNGAVVNITPAAHKL